MSPGVTSISVVMPVYNGELYLREALKSVLAQSRPADEILAVDNGSTDGSLDVLRSFGVRVRLLSEARKGLSHSRNAGLGRARGSHVAFLDQDDCWHPDKLRIYEDKAREHPEVGLFYSDAVAVNVQGTPYRLMSGDPGPGRLFETMLMENRILTSTVMLRREAFEKAGAMRTDFRHPAAVGDWEYFLRLAKMFPACYIARALTRYRVHVGGAIRAGCLQIKEDSLRVVALHGEGAGVPQAVREEALSSVYFHSGVRNLAAADPKEARRDLFQSLRYRARVLKVFPLLLASFLPEFLLRLALRVRRVAYRGFFLDRASLSGGPRRGTVDRLLSPD